MQKNIDLISESLSAACDFKNRYPTQNNKYSQMIFSYCSMSSLVCWTHLCHVLVGSWQRAVGVCGIKTGAVHIAMVHLCFDQHLLPAVHRILQHLQLSNESHRIKVGPLHWVSAAVGKSNYFIAGCSNRTCYSVKNDLMKLGLGDMTPLSYIDDVF